MKRIAKTIGLLELVVGQPVQAATCMDNGGRAP